MSSPVPMERLSLKELMVRLRSSLNTVLEAVVCLKSSEVTDQQIAIALGATIIYEDNRDIPRIFFIKDGIPLGLRFGHDDHMLNLVDVGLEKLLIRANLLTRPAVVIVRGSNS